MTLADDTFQQQKSRLRSVVAPSSSVNCCDHVEVRFKQGIIQEIPQSVQRVAVLVTPEYEGIFRNGGLALITAHSARDYRHPVSM